MIKPFSALKAKNVEPQQQSGKYDVAYMHMEFCLQILSFLMVSVNDLDGDLNPS